MLKEAGGIVGGALVFSPLGMPLLFQCGQGSRWGGGTFCGQCGRQAGG